jgi:hypothetical protein
MRQKFLDQVLSRVVVSAGVPAGSGGKAEKQIGFVEDKKNDVDG